MSWSNIFNAQMELDNVIRKEKGLDAKETARDISLALLTEIGETANETRFFKVWSVDQEIRKEKALGELVDIVHFATSLALTHGYGYSIIDRAKENKILEEFNDLHHAFARLFAVASVLNMDILFEEVHEETLIVLFTEILATASVLGFSEEDLFEAYFIKNVINHDRQKNGY